MRVRRKKRETKKKQMQFYINRDIRGGKGGEGIRKGIGNIGH